MFPIPSRLRAAFIAVQRRLRQRGWSLVRRFMATSLPLVVPCGSRELSSGFASPRKSSTPAPERCRRGQFFIAGNHQVEFPSLEMIEASLAA